MGILFAGRRWTVVSIDEDRSLVHVVPSRGGRAMWTGGEGPVVHERVRQEMLALYSSREVPEFLDATARRFLEEGREAFGRLGLREAHLLEAGDETLLFPWTGDREMATIVLMLRERGIDATEDGVAVTISAVGAEPLRKVLRELASGSPVDANRLASQVANKLIEKHDVFLPKDALIADYAAKRLDAVGAHRALTRLF
jgi:ATP-dependent Lhr-like helicase